MSPAPLRAVSGAAPRAAAGPYALLALAILCWGGNFAVGRWANLDAPPVALSFWRHVAAALMALPFVAGRIGGDWPAVRRHAGLFAALSALFVAGNTLVYFSVLHTTVINAALINAGVPVAAAVFSWMVLRTIINRWQALGVGACFAGIALVVTGGEPRLLLALGFGWGDIFMLAAVVWMQPIRARRVIRKRLTTTNSCRLSGAPNRCVQRPYQLCMETEEEAKGLAFLLPCHIIDNSKQIDFARRTEVVLKDRKSAY